MQQTLSSISTCLVHIHSENESVLSLQIKPSSNTIHIQNISQGSMKLDANPIRYMTLFYRHGEQLFVDGSLSE